MARRRVFIYCLFRRVAPPNFEEDKKKVSQLFFFLGRGRVEGNTQSTPESQVAGGGGGKLSGHTLGPPPARPSLGEIPPKFQLVSIVYFINVNPFVDKLTKMAPNPPPAKKKKSCAHFFLVFFKIRRCNSAKKTILFF